MILADIKNPYIGVALASTKIISTPDVREVICAVSLVTKVEEEEMKQKNRSPRIVFARFMCWRLLREYSPKISLKELGRMFGDFDHTTAMHGIKTTQDRIDVEDEVREIYYEIKRKIKLRSAINTAA